MASTCATDSGRPTGEDVVFPGKLAARTEVGRAVAGVHHAPADDLEARVGLSHCVDEGIVAEPVRPLADVIGARVDPQRPSQTALAISVARQLANVAVAHHDGFVVVIARGVGDLEDHRGSASV